MSEYCLQCVHFEWFHGDNISPYYCTNYKEYLNNDDVSPGGLGSSCRHFKKRESKYVPLFWDDFTEADLEKHGDNLVFYSDSKKLMYKRKKGMIN